MDRYVSECLRGLDKTAFLSVDAEIREVEITENTAQEIALLEPYGSRILNRYLSFGMRKFKSLLL